MLMYRRVRYVHGLLVFSHSLIMSDPSPQQHNQEGMILLMAEILHQLIW